MNLTFTVSMDLGQDVAFCPGADEKFLAAELCAYATRLAAFYTANGRADPPEVSVSWEDAVERKRRRCEEQILAHPAEGQP